MSKLSIIIGLLILTNCKAQEKSASACKLDTPTEIDWIKPLIKDREKAYLFSFKSDGKTIIEYHHCFRCPDAIVAYYQCNGEKICDQGGFLGTNSCPEFDISDRKQIYPVEK